MTPGVHAAAKRSFNPAIAQCYIDCGQYLELFEAYNSVEHIDLDILSKLQWEEVCRVNGTKRFLVDIGKHHEVWAGQIVQAAIDVNDLALAKHLAQAFKLELAKFPVLLQGAYASTFEHFRFVKKFSQLGLIKLCAQDAQACCAFLVWSHSLGMGMWGKAMACLWRYGMSEEARHEFARDHPLMTESVLKVRVSDQDLDDYWHSEDSAIDKNPKFLHPEDIGLCTEDVHLIGDYDELVKFQEEIQNAKIVGIDAEWKTALVSGSEKPPSLFQLAYSTDSGRIRVLLIDLLPVHSVNVSENSDDGRLSLLAWIRDFLASDQGPYKIALNFSGDLQKFASFKIPGWKWTTSKMSDLQVVVRYALLTQIDPGMKERLEQISRKSSPSYATFSCSLSEAVHLLLGKPMQKYEQCSNWELRPLTVAQTIYAAMDVAVIVAAVLKIMSATMLTSFDPIPNHVKNALTQKPAKLTDVAPSKLEILKARCAKFHIELENERAKFAQVKRELGIDQWEFVTTNDEVKLARTLRGIGLNVKSANVSGRGWTRLVRGLKSSQVALCPLGRQAEQHGKAELQYTFKTAKLEDRVREMIVVFDVAYNPDKLCERCSECGSDAWQPIEKAEVELPASVVEHGTEFRYCGACSKIFWQGSVYDQARQRFALFFQKKEFSIDTELSEMNHASSGFS